MPRIPEDQLRRLLTEVLAPFVFDLQLPPSIEGHFHVRFRATPAGPALQFHLAVKTITNDTREAGRWSGREKIQLTGLEGVPHLDALLGVTVKAGEVVLVAIDPTRHLPVTGESNNVQFPETLPVEAGATGHFVTHRKRNGELVRAFPGGMLASLLLARQLAGGDQAAAELEADETAAAEARFRVARTRIRMPAFRRNVLAAYGSVCGACGAALELCEAAHIVPHAVSLDDSVVNGVCLCPNHHTAFDLAELVTFDGARQIWINQAKLAFLEGKGLGAGMPLLIDPLRPVLSEIAVDQQPRLAERFLQDTDGGTAVDDGTWIPISRLRQGRRR